MPYKNRKDRRKKYNRKYKRGRGTLIKRGKLVMSKGLRQAVHYFKRRTMSYLVPPDSLSGWVMTDDFKAYQKTFMITFDMLEGYTELAALYEMYKINGVKIKFFMSPQTTVGARDVHPMILRYSYNRTGDDLSSNITESQWLQTGAVKYRTIPQANALTFYARPRVAKTVYNSPVAGYAVAKPMWFGTHNAPGGNNQQGIPHYSFDMRLSKVDGSVLTGTPLPILAIETTCYLACKGVQ